MWEWNGVVMQKSDPCHQKCWNAYRYSKKLFKTATFYCHEEDRCLPVDQMCSGVCKDDHEVCGPADIMRCKGYGYEHDSRVTFANDYTVSWYQHDDKITDPHGCQKRCKTTTNAGADCLACEHPDFFKCNSTGYCINSDLVCDHHPHPNCGGDDEGIYHCLEIYLKKRLVKSYATLSVPARCIQVTNFV